ncbi:MAG: ABC-2 type transport system permease protein [Myxococcota bacterium]
MSLRAIIRPSLRLGVNLVLAYRLEVAVQILSASIVALLNWSLWTAIFQGRDLIAGRTAAELTTYVVVAWIVTTFYANRIDQWLSARFRNGNIAIDLLRPWSLQAHLYFRDLGRAGCALVMTTLPLALWTGALLPLRTPTRWWTWAVFGLSLLFAHAISFGFSWLVGMAAFRLRNAAGLAHLKATVISVFSGALIPLDLYPESIRWLILLLPFQGMSHVPASIFVETVAVGEVWQVLMTQAVWAVVLAVLGVVAFRRAGRIMIVQGG